MSTLLGRVAFLVVALPLVSYGDCTDSSLQPDPASSPECARLETMTIFGTAPSARDVAGGASTVTPQDLEQFVSTDIARALRRIPGISLQIEDGWALRPNISIRGTASERSSRVTLLEDNVLIAPAPYAAPAAYYFPTFGRINAVEVLKGPASITQGPYTVGGAVNLTSTPIPDDDRGFVRGEFGSDATWRVHGWYGGGGERMQYLVETHQWRSDGYQSVDRSTVTTGFDKQDYVAKLGFTSDPTAAVYQQLDIKLQYSEEDSDQSYLGLTDTDFFAQSQRRYSASQRDKMKNEHDQVVVSWRLETPDRMGLSLTAYSNDTERAWYKTEGLDADGSDSPESFSRTSWASVLAAINQDNVLAGLTPEQLQAILNGADTPEGSIQLRNNAREYFARGVQLVLDMPLQTRGFLHELQAGLRYHEDQEDRLQRNDNYQQLNGQLLLNTMGMQGNAGNQVQDATAWAAYVYDRIVWDDWTLTPGLRYENIDLSRTRWNTSSADPASRDPENFHDYRENKFDIWLPGLGLLYAPGSATRIVAGVHKGFATPSNAPGVDPEESVNYELGFRYDTERLSLEAMLFFNDYDNLVGVCTNASGSDCDPGDAFNGNGVHVPGLELTLSTWFEPGSYWQIPVQVAYTWMNAEFQTAFDSEFFGEVHAGDPVPYVPDSQLWATVGLEGGKWSLYLSGSYAASVCTEVGCNAFERTGSATIYDASVHFRAGRNWELYGLAQNLTDQVYIAARDPYGARPNKPRTFMAGIKLEF